MTYFSCRYRSGGTTVEHPQWWSWSGSNRRPTACKAAALPAELQPHTVSSNQSMVGLVGFEPTTPALSRRCSNQLSYRPSHLLRGSSLEQPISCGYLADCSLFLLKGGDPAAPSDTATLLRLHPSYRSRLRQLPPYGWVTDFGHYLLPWCDVRCVQDPGTYSPRHSDSRLLAIPASCSRVADYNPN